MSELLFWIIATAAGVVITLSFAPLLADEKWWARLPGFAMAQLAATLVALMGLSAVVFDLTRPGVLAMLAGMAAALAYVLWHLVPYSRILGKQIGDAADPEGVDRVTIVSMNLLVENRDSDAVLHSVAAADPDLFLALEANDFWQASLAPLLTNYPYRIAARRDDYWGMVLYSRLPLAEGCVRHQINSMIPSISAEVQLLSGATIMFVGAHPRPPMLRSAVARDAELVRIGMAIGDSDMPTLLAGDLNDVPWSRTLRLARRLGGLNDPRVGRGFVASFNVQNPMTRWPLDHIIATRQFNLLRFKKLPTVGSDHFPMLAEFALARGAAPGPNARRRRNDRDRAERLIARGLRAAPKN